MLQEALMFEARAMYTEKFPALRATKAPFSPAEAGTNLRKVALRKRLFKGSYTGPIRDKGSYTGPIRVPSRALWFRGYPKAHGPP